jgi:ribonucleoside-diphosphate reductase alpha chain
MGSTKAVTAFNCFVSGTIEDTLLDGSGSIHARAGEALRTMRMGGGIGYDFSTLRPRGAVIKKLQSRSSGPVSWMEYYDAGGRAIASSGHRRGAQMGVMRVDHPDIEEFVRAKQNTNQLTGFNISVAVTDKFMDAVYSNSNFTLRWGNENFREVYAPELWDLIMRAAWDWAEPGILFVDQINRYNNLWYCEKIAATNPCGEVPLPPYGACLLGSFNLTKYLRKGAIAYDVEGSQPPRYWFDEDQLREDIPYVVRAMDNVTDRTSYPLYEQEKEAKSKRRMGIGICGLANCIEAMGHPYGSTEAIYATEHILSIIRDESYMASVMLSREKGAFPMFEERLYMKGAFINTLPDSIRSDIRTFGIRNSHLTSIAPTGTISTCADNISGGIEPVFAYEMERTIIEFEGERVEVLQDYGLKNFGVKGKVSSDVTVEEHVAVLTSAQRYVDAAISKTCNVTSDIGWEAFKDIYVHAHNGGAKGCTAYRKDGLRGSVLKEVACTIDPETGARSCA